MNDERKVMDKTTGELQSGYTLEAHEFYEDDLLADYAANTHSTLIGTYTDNGDGTYSLDIATSVFGVIVLKNSAGTAIRKLPSGTNKYIKLNGDNQLDIEP